MSWILDQVVVRGGRERFARSRAKAHLSRDETVSKMGHPGVWLDSRPGPPAL